MKFIDEAKVTAQSGDGGAGCVSFRRERFVPRGGPDGGDGGKGGDVIFITSPGKRTLYDFQHQKLLKAQNGTGGKGSQKTGKNGKDLIIEIPPGTIILDADTGEIIKDFTETGESYIIAKGGIGGRGNRRFSTSRNRAPKFAQPGMPGESMGLKLELKLLADVGLIGLPNAGKSTLISSISSARPKIADYPFTTLIPNLGVVKTGYGEPFVVADIPGLIQGAHTGAGLGIQFLKHIERTKIIAHLIDASTINPDSPLEAYNTINNELAKYSEKLADKEQIIVLNKLDIPEAAENAELFQNALENETIVLISAATGNGTDQLKSLIIRTLEPEEH